MMTALTCFDYESKEIVNRYIAGGSSAAETEDFELHLIGCAACQDSVRVGAVARAALRSPRRGDSMPPRRILAWGRMLALAAGLGTIALGAYWLRQRSGEIEALGNLAVVPSYQGMEVRSSIGAADSLFAHGMSLYVEGRHAEARDALSRAMAQGSDSVPASFFIGAIDVLHGDPRSALTSLRVVLRRGDTPYAAEAHYYAAKAFLQLGRPDSAAAHLRAAAGGPLGVGAMARALADSVSEIQR